MANHLENLLCQFYDWKGWLVKNNIKVGRLSRGGYGGELDVVVYNPDPKSQEVIHYEPSTDASSWADREAKYKKKFAFGREHIIKDVFPWLPPDIHIRQVAVFFNVSPNRKKFVGAEAMTIDELVGMIASEIKKRGCVGGNAIPEQYDLLRTMQLVLCGYIKPKTDG